MGWTVFSIVWFLGLENIGKANVYASVEAAKTLEKPEFLALLWFSEDGLKISSPWFGNHGFLVFICLANVFLLLGIEIIPTLPK